jgi:hypothetical protein
MELLSEVTINTVLHRVSDDWQNLTNQWEPKLISYTPVRVGLPTVYGGYAKPKFGSRSFSPDLFDGTDWPPPKTVTVKDMLTESTEAAAITVFEGTLHLEAYNETEVVYNAYGEEYTATIADSTALSGTLASIFTTYCGATHLNLTLDTTDARGTTPTITYTTSGEQMTIDVLSKLAAYCSHCFYIDDGTLYLVDMLTGDDNSYSLDEFGYFMGSEYRAQQPVSLIKGTDTSSNERSVDGSYQYGEELTVDIYDNNQTRVETELGNIKTLVEKDYYRFRVIPEADKLPTVGEVITVTNESLQESTTVEFIVTDYAPDILKQEILIEGVGAEV